MKAVYRIVSTTWVGRHKGAKKHVLLQTLLTS